MVKSYKPYQVILRLLYKEVPYLLIFDNNQIQKLEIKVHSLLYLNKLNYFKDKKEILLEQYDVSLIINEAAHKFKISRPDVNFILDIDNKIFLENDFHVHFESQIFFRCCKGAEIFPRSCFLLCLLL